MHDDFSVSCTDLFPAASQSFPNKANSGVYSPSANSYVGKASESFLMGSTGAQPHNFLPTAPPPLSTPPPNSTVDDARRVHGAYSASCGDVGGGLAAGGSVKGQERWCVR